MVDPLGIRLAERLKRLRRDHGWSLEQLANNSGVSRATLSRMENAEVSPTTDVLGKLCTAYHLTLSRLLSMVEDGYTVLVKKQDQGVWKDPDAGFKRQSISPPSASLKAEMLQCGLSAGARLVYDKPSIEGLEHHLFLQEGNLRVTVNGQQHELNAGDCLRYLLYGPTEFQTKDDQPAKYILVLV